MVTKNKKMEELDVNDYGNQTIEEIEANLQKEKNLRKSHRQRLVKSLSSAIIGIVELVVVLQLLYTALYLLGVELPFSKWMVIPQLIVAGYLMVDRFIINRRK